MRISDWSSDVCSSDLNQGESLVDDLTALVDDWDADHGPLRVCAAGSEAPLAGHSLATLCVGRRCRGCDDATDACVGVVLENVALGLLGVEPGEPTAHVHQGGDPSGGAVAASKLAADLRSEEHTSELQSLMRISYAVFCLK